MDISELTALVSPPNTPVGVAAMDEWTQLQERIGLRLPTDLYNLASVYGSGGFLDGFLEVFNPFASYYQEMVDYELEWLRMSQKRGLEFDVFPRDGGLFPWGRDKNGDLYCWSTNGAPDDWAVVFLENEGDEMIFEIGMTELLVRSMKNEIRLWPNVIPPEQLVFVPDTDSDE